MPDSPLSGVADPELRAALTGLGELVQRFSRRPVERRLAVSTLRIVIVARALSNR
jgi:hypothetical protein